MSVSKIEIVNKALHHLGVERINDMADNNKRAIVMTDIYDITRKTVLEDHIWPFAKKRAALTPLALPPAFGYAYQYNLPSDFLTGVKEENDIEYFQEGSTILSDSNVLQLIYITDLQDVAKFSPGFVEAFALRLAHDSCYSITQSKELMKDLMGRYQLELANARYRQDRGQSPVDPIIDSWINVRI
jgi:hypothetical protein